jgi:hypothetical protein
MLALPDSQLSNTAVQERLPKNEILFALIDSRQPTNNRAPLSGQSCAANRVPMLLSRWSHVSDLVDVADVDADPAREWIEPRRAGS